MLLNVILALLLSSGFFILGVYFADRYHQETDIRVKEALEKQYLRLSCNMDADDPVRPYIAPRTRRTARTSTLSGELLTEFKQKMNKDGKATVFINNANNWQGQTGDDPR